MRSLPSRLKNFASRFRLRAVRRRASARRTRSRRCGASSRVRVPGLPSPTISLGGHGSGMNGRRAVTAGVLRPVTGAAPGRPQPCRQPSLRLLRARRQPPAAAALLRSRRRCRRQPRPRAFAASSSSSAPSRRMTTVATTGSSPCAPAASTPFGQLDVASACNECSTARSPRSTSMNSGRSAGRQ